MIVKNWLRVLGSTEPVVRKNLMSAVAAPSMRQLPQEAQCLHVSAREVVKRFKDVVQLLCSDCPNSLQQTSPIDGA